MIDHEMTDAIAKKIREIRQQQGVTLSDLSKRTVLSKSLLSKIENGRTIPSLPVFMNLAKALNTNPSDFFEGTSLHGDKNFIHLKKSSYSTMKKEGRMGFEYNFILSQMLPGCRWQSYLLTVQPKSESKPTTTDGFEFKYMIHGRCDYHIGDEVITLEEGDSLYFDASKPHMPVNRSKGKVVMLVLYFIKTESN
ncbi:transcriptional regulator [Cytophagales bacterium WSM2-2]|nr:transcriptional regulator [Cytophagales bacterium WSM2-2]